MPCSARSIATACSGSGVTCSLRFFMRSAGIRQSAASRSNSAHWASAASLGRQSVSHIRGKAAMEQKLLYLRVVMFPVTSRQCLQSPEFCSDVEAKMHDVAVAHHVVLALEAHLPGFLGALLTLAGDEIGKGDHLGA